MEYLDPQTGFGRGVDLPRKESVSWLSGPIDLPGRLGKRPFCVRSVGHTHQRRQYLNELPAQAMLTGAVLRPSPFSLSMSKVTGADKWSGFQLFRRRKTGGGASGKKDGVRLPTPLGASPFRYNKAEAAGLMSRSAESLRRPRATREQTGGDGEPRSDVRPASGTGEGYDHFTPGVRSLCFVARDRWGDRLTGASRAAVAGLCPSGMRQNVGPQVSVRE